MQSALMITAWRTATLPAHAATACAEMLPARLCWALSGVLYYLAGLQGVMLQTYDARLLLQFARRNVCERG